MKHVFYFILLTINLLVFASEKQNRIISLAPNITEVIYALGLGNQLIANTQLCDYPKDSTSKPKIGNFINPNIEKMIQLQPTLVVATVGTPLSILERINSLGIPVFRYNPHTLKDIEDQILELSKKLDAEKNGLELVNKIELSIFNLKKSTIKNQNKKYLFLIQLNPIYSLTNKTWIGELFNFSGFKNIIPDKLGEFPIIDKELILKEKPKIVFTSGLFNKTEEESRLYFQKEFYNNFGPEFTKNIRFVFLPKDIFVRSGPRVIDAANYLSKMNL